MGVEADYALGQLYDQLINAVNPTDAASLSGSLAAIVKYIAAGSVTGYQASSPTIPNRTSLPTLEQWMLTTPGTQSLVDSTTWPANNDAIYIPFSVDQDRTITKAYVIVGTSSGNLDFGIYPRTGGAKLVTLGSTAVAAAGVQTLDVADTSIPKGKYLAALSCSTTAAALGGFNTGAGLTAGAGALANAIGIKKEASALALPASATPVAPTSSFVPLIVLEWS